MIEAYALAALALIIGGAVLGFIAIVALGIHREEAARSMTVPTSDRIALGTRTANGFYARTPGVIAEALMEAEALTR
jgi:hypothetical protein